jgi:hypothetical protein
MMGLCRPRQENWNDELIPNGFEVIKNDALPVGASRQDLVQLIHADCPHLGSIQGFQNLVGYRSVCCSWSEWNT